MISLRTLNEQDISIIKSWPPYPAEFFGPDYTLRDNGWPDKYTGKAGSEILVAEDAGTIAGFSILSRKADGCAEFRIALHPERVGHGLGKTIALFTNRQRLSLGTFNI
jgi:diamine N-acetyltransferase